MGFKLLANKNSDFSLKILNVLLNEVKKKNPRLRFPTFLGTEGLQIRNPTDNII